MANINFGIGFKLDKSGLNTAKQELSSISKQLDDMLKDKKLNIDRESIQKAQTDVRALEQALDKAFDKDISKLNLKTLDAELKKSKITISGVADTFKRLGIDGTDAFMRIQSEALKTGIEVKKTKSFLDDMSETLVRTAKWSIASSAINSLSGSLQKAVGFVKGMDESLTNIRVVTNKSTAEMEVFAKQANNAAKALGKTTKEYADASLIYFQQGKSAGEVKELTEATLVGANVTGTEVSEMAELLTAVMNGYTLEASKAMDVTDKLAAVGAATGSDFEELATAMSKVSSMAKVAGVDIDQLNAQLATIVTVTREAPESIGTSLKTIFGRMSELKAGGEDEDGWTTGKVEQAFQKVGLSVLDSSNNLRDMGEVIEEVGSKWSGFDRNSQLALANAMAGQRQANRLIALFENWDMYSDSLEVSQQAQGAAMEQNIIRMDSLDYKSKQLRAEMEELWSKLLDEDVLKTLTVGLTSVVSGLNDIVDGFGGVGGTLTFLGGVVTSVFGDKIAKSIIKAKNSVVDFIDTARASVTGMGEVGKLTSVEEAARQAAQSRNDGAGDQIALNLIDKRVKLRQQEEVIAKNLSKEELAQFQKIKEELLVEEEKLALLKKQREEKEKAAKESLEEYKKDVELTGMSDAEVQETITRDLQLHNKALEEQYEQLKKIEQLKNLEGVSQYDLELRLVAQNTKELTQQELILKQHLATKKKSISDYESIDELMQEISDEYEDQLDSIEKEKSEIARLEQAHADLNTTMNAGTPTVEEAYTERNIESLQAQVDLTEQAAVKQERLSLAVQAVGFSLQALASINSLKILGDDMATSEEKTNGLLTGLGGLTTAMMGLVPVLFALKVSFETTGNTAAAAWLKILGPIGIAIGAVAALAFAFVKVSDALDPVTRATKKNNEVLEKQNKLLAEAKARLNDLKTAQQTFVELQQMMTTGTDELGNALYGNISDLDTEQYEEYVKLSNELAQTAPHLVKYYDEMGNAIVDLNGDYDALIEAEKENMRIANAALAANSGNFATEYSAEIEEAQRLINLKQKQLRSIADGTSNLGKEQISVLTAEINELQSRIQDTQVNIRTNIVEPLFNGSEAYAKLSKENKEFARGLLDTGRVNSKLGDPESLKRYTDMINTLMNEMSLTDAEITSTMEELQKLEVNGISDEEVAKYDELNAKLEQLKATSAEVGQVFEGMTDIQKQNVLEIASLFEVSEGKLNSLMAKISETAASSEAMTAMISTGEGPDVGELMSAAGMEVVDRSAEIQQSQQKRDALSQELQTIGELQLKYMEYKDILIAGGELTEEQLATSAEYIALKERQQEVESELTQTQAESIMLKAEQDAFDREQLELQEQLEEQMWNNVDALLETTEGYNQLVEVYNSSIESVGNMTETLGGLEDAFTNMDADALTEALSGYEDKIPDLSDALDGLADNSEESFNKVRDVVNKVADEQGKLYAKMKGQDAEYWASFQQKNRNQTALIEMEYGIRASDYANYQEYEKAIANLTEKDKVRYMDDATRERIMKMNEEELAAYITAQNQALYTYEGYQSQVASSAASSEVQVSNMDKLRAAGLTTSQAMAVAAAQGLDTVLNASSGFINGIIGGMNSAIAAAETLVNAAIKGWNLVAETLNKIPGVNLPTASLWSASRVGSFTGSNLAGSLYDKFQDKNQSSKPSFDFDYGNAGTIDKRPTSPIAGGSGSGGATPSGPGVNSGGGDKDSGSDSGSEEKEVEDLEWEEDIYHDINILIEKKSQLLEKLQEQQDKLYGKELLDNLAQQKKALQEQQKLYEQKLEMQKKDLANQRSALSGQGVQFNVDGTIANYNALLKQKLAYVNSLSGEAKEAAKEEFSALTEMMEKYEDMLMNGIYETETAIQEAIDAQREIFLQEFEYTITLRLDIAEDVEKALDFMKEMNDEFEDYSDNFERTTDQIKNQLSLIESLKSQLEKVNNDPSLTEKERLEMLEKYNEELQDSVKELKKLDEELTTIFNNTLKDGLDIVKEHSEEFKYLNDQLKHLEQSLSLLGEGDNYNLLDKIYEEQYDSLMGQVGVMNAQMEALKAQKAALEAAGMKGTEEWKSIDKAIKDTQSTINSLAQESLKILQKEFKNSIEGILSDLEKGISGGLGLDELKNQQKELKDERSKYLDGEEKLLAVSKLQQKVQKDMETTSDPKRRAELQKFMDSELKALKEKDKLTKYDVDRANKVYDLTLKQMALDEQRATKNIMRLVRDTQGNWVYEFTEDAKAIEKAQEDVSSAMEELMELDKKKLEETQDLMIKLQEEYYKEVQQLAKDAADGKFATEEEMREKLQEITDKYNEKMVEANATYEEVKRNATISSMAVIVNTYSKTGDVLENLTEEQEILLQALSDKTGDSFLTMSDVVQQLISGDDDSILSAMKYLGLTTDSEMTATSNKIGSTMANLGSVTQITLDGVKNAVSGLVTNMQSDWGLKVTDMISSMVGSGGFKEQSNSAIDSIMNKWKEYQNKVKEVQSATGLDMNGIINKIDGVDKATEELNKETDKLINKFVEEMSALTDLSSAYQKNREQIKQNIDATLDYIDKINKAIDAIKRKNDIEANPPKPSTPTTTPSTSSPSTSTPSKPSTSTGTQGNGQIDKGDKVTVKNANANAWYTAYGTEVLPWSRQAAAVGKAWNDQFYVYNQANGRVALSKAPGEMAMAWVNQGELQGFDTGGYTGDWSDNSGKLAMLHEKELVLNKEDTANILDTVQLVRGLSSSALDGIAGTILETSRRTLKALGEMARALRPNSQTTYSNSQSIEQNITIEADFSGVKSADEIEKAFENMANMASQYVARK